MAERSPAGGRVRAPDGSTRELVRLAGRSATGTEAGVRAALAVVVDLLERAAARVRHPCLRVLRT
jgi:hypothetical protein